MTENKVVYVKLITGEEIIGLIKSTSIENVTIDDVMIFIEHFDAESGTSKVLLNKYMPFNSTNTITFQKRHIVSAVPVMEEMKLFYNNPVYQNQKFIDNYIKDKLDHSNDQITELEELELFNSFATSNTLH